MADQIFGQSTTEDHNYLVIEPDGSINANIVTSLVPIQHDELALTYVTTGNGIGEIKTVVYKLATVTVATLTLTYDANNKLSSVVRS